MCVDPSCTSELHHTKTIPKKKQIVVFFSSFTLLVSMSSKGKPLPKSAIVEANGHIAQLVHDNIQLTEKLAASEQAVLDTKEVSRISEPDSSLYPIVGS